jgi:1-acyl-sn-glycerol-3-phosphate acyltransferase
VKGGVEVISPNMAKLIEILPSGLVKAISKKVINGYIKKYANITVRGMENISNVKRPVIFICNHLSNSDGLVLNTVFKNEDLTFVAGVKLSEDPVTNLGINMIKTIPIKPNSADKDAISKTIKLIKKGNNILIFPEGTRSRTSSMIEAKKGILLIAKITNVPVIPVGIWGTEKLLPISNGNMGGEKFNYADVFVNIGKPIVMPEINQEESRHAYEDRILGFIMKKVAVLIPEKYKGFYSK